MSNHYPPEFDGPTHCEVCGHDVDHKTSACECPECTVCEEVGNLGCFGTHMGALHQRYEWTTVWDNGHACDELGTFDTKQAAVGAGEDWLSEMIAIDPSPVEAAEAYSYEVLEPVEVPNTAADVLRASGVEVSNV